MDDSDPIDRILEHNRFVGPVLGLHELRPEPAVRLAVVTCMDARIDLRRVLGVKEGDVHHLRNAGGTVTDDTLRSLVVSQRLLGTRSILLIHHTDCGMLRFRDDDLAREIEAATGYRPPFELGAFTDLEDDVRASAEKLRSSPFLAYRDRICGYVLDMETGRLHAVT